MDIGVNPYILEQHLSQLGNITETVSVALGVALVLGAIFKFKRYGEMRTQGSAQMTMAGPMVMLLCGAVLLFVPSFTHILLNAFWGPDTSPLAYPDSGTSGLDALEPVIFTFVRLVGIIAFIRGVMLFSKTGKEGSQPGTLGKAAVHTLGGLLCIHIIGTVHLLQQLTGFVD